MMILLTLEATDLSKTDSSLDQNIILFLAVAMDWTTASATRSDMSTREAKVFRYKYIHILLAQCATYSRSMAVPRENCTLGPREQGNMVSSYLDGSQIYGSITDTVNRLRKFTDGTVD